MAVLGNKVLFVDVGVFVCLRVLIKYAAEAAVGTLGVAGGEKKLKAAAADIEPRVSKACLLYTSDAADEL